MTKYDEEIAASLRLKIKSLGYLVERQGNLKHPNAQFDHYVWMLVDDYMTGIPTNCGYLGWREDKGWYIDIDLDFLPIPPALALWNRVNEVCLVTIPAVEIHR